MRKEDCRFIVNEEARKVICIIDKCKYDFLKFADNNHFIVHPENLFVDEADRLYDTLVMPNRFVGVATCDMEDTWNEDFGRELAYTKARDKYNKSFWKRANKYIDTLDTWAEEAVQCLDRYGEKLAQGQERRHTKITDYLENGVS